jgi:hypothetical protein
MGEPREVGGAEHAGVRVSGEGQDARPLSADVLQRCNPLLQRRHLLAGVLVGHSCQLNPDQLNPET